MPRLFDLKNSLEDPKGEEYWMCKFSMLVLHHRRLDGVRKTVPTAMFHTMQYV